ncbi:hypothetical protein [Vallitalea okinawensis]|uniref:hypothetical protein n=1 Tax=Vallitalea okinawensis TaxID=2078660 RepID=UPI00130054C6|nr:hypothetical protein [Vallitalea okinawensis]
MLFYRELGRRLNNNQLRYHQYLQIERDNELKREYDKDNHCINFQNIAKYNQ